MRPRLGSYWTYRPEWSEVVVRTWQAADAKQNFARLVDAAQTEPQVVLRHADPVGILVSVSHYEALKAQADAEFARFLTASPLEAEDFDANVGMGLGDG